MEEIMSQDRVSIKNTNQLILSNYQLMQYIKVAIHALLKGQLTSSVRACGKDELYGNVRYTC